MQEILIGAVPFLIIYICWVLSKIKNELTNKLEELEKHAILLNQQTDRLVQAMERIE